MRLRPDDSVSAQAAQQRALLLQRLHRQPLAADAVARARRLLDLSYCDGGV